MSTLVFYHFERQRQSNNPSAITTHNIKFRATNKPIQIKTYYIASYRFNRYYFL